MKKFFLSTVLLSGCLACVNAQYKQQEYQKYPEQQIFPQTPFDSVAAKYALAKGTATVKGVAFTRQKGAYGIKEGPKIYANHIMVELFPLTPYFQEWYNLKNKAQDLKRNKIVYMSNEAYRFRLTCETDSRGEFTFPDMQPGKYIVEGVLPWTASGSYNQYTGSAYDNYGDQTNYYQKQYYTVNHSDYLMDIIEVKPGETVVNVKLK